MITRSKKVCISWSFDFCVRRFRIYVKNLHCLPTNILQRAGDKFFVLNPTRTNKKRKSNPDVTQNIVDRNLELTDPTPNIQDLFKSLDERCFAGILSKNHVWVGWSASLLHYDAGYCTAYESMENNIKKLFVIIELGEALLKFRTRRDLVETLLVN